MKTDVFHCGYVAIVGKPNVGKSTLLNLLLGEKLSAVTPKPQTTRHRILGILNGENYQIIFLDTPGLISEPKYKLQELMKKTLNSAIKGADLVVVMREVNDESQIESELLNHKKGAILVINKIDLIQKDGLLPLIGSVQKLYDFKEIIPISAIKKEGIDRLLDCIIKYLPANPAYFPKDILTNQPEKFFVAEIIREKIFKEYGEEVPYSTTVAIEEFKEREGRKDYIRAIIYVEKDSQKAILIGAKGDKLKKIGSIARQEIEAFLDRPVFLELWVKTKKKWKDNLSMLKSFGY
ncbi:MAG: GTPase Era [Nitrospirota bacterium]